MQEGGYRHSISSHGQIWVTSRTLRYVGQTSMMTFISLFHLFIFLKKMFEFTSFFTALYNFTYQSRTIDQIYVKFLHVVPCYVYSILNKRRLQMLNDDKMLAVLINLTKTVLFPTIRSSDPQTKSPNDSCDCS